MQQHAEQLAAALKTAKYRTDGGSLSIREPHSLAPPFDEDEEEYALKRALAEAQRSLAREQELEEMEQDEEKETNNPDVYDKHDFTAELLTANTRSFLTTIQHKDVAHADEIMYKRDGLERNMPLPITLETESEEYLRTLRDTLGSLTGVEISHAEQARLPSIHDSVWNVQGCASGAPELRFTARFQVNNKVGSISELGLELQDLCLLELGEIAVYCEEHCCFRTFMTCFAQYGELYHARENLFQDLVEMNPDRIVIRSMLEKLPSTLGARVLEIDGIRERVWVAWEPTFTFQSIHNEKHELDGLSLRPKLTFFRGKSSTSFKEDHSVESIVRMHGLATALRKVASALLS